MRTGADISHHQATFDAARYFASEDFLIHKATEGGSFIDSAFRARFKACLGQPRGAYHFARPSGATVDAQADHFIATVRAAGWGSGDVWVLDLEDAGGLGSQALVTWADRWCSRVRAALGGRGLFYSYPFFVRDQLGDPGRIPGGCLGWWARYASTPYGGLFQPAGWPNPPSVWQCSNGQTGCVTNVASVGRCDYNRMTDAAFAELFGPQEDDMYDADAEARLFKRIEEAERRTARWVDHGTADTTGSDDHHERIRGDLASLRAILEAGGTVTLTPGDLQEIVLQVSEKVALQVVTELKIGGHPRMRGVVELEAEPPG